MYRLSFVLTIACLSMAAWLNADQDAPPPGGAQIAAPGTDVAPHRAMVDKYCVRCHNGRLKTGGIELDALDLSRPGANPDVWERVARRVRAGMMPPAGMPRPDEATRAAFVSWLEASLDRSARDNPNPGRPLLHRLNRTEYANAIRDLLDVEIDVAPLLPPDDPAFGFDNIADVLGVSPALTERHLSAAGKISALAVGDRETAPTSILLRVRQDLSQDRHLDGLPIGTVGGLTARVVLPLDAEYAIQPRLFRSSLGVTKGLEYSHELEVSVDGIRVHLATFGGRDDFTASLKNSTKLADEVDGRLRVRLPLKAGPHVISVAFVQKSSVLGTLRLQPYLRSSADPIDHTGLPHLDTVLMTGPFDPTGPGDTPSRRRVFTCRPARASDEVPCAQRILTTLARRAYRRPVTNDERERLFIAYRAGRENGDFEKGIELGLQYMLVSPSFIFRSEDPPSGLQPGAVYTLRDTELASRLSFFLWSSIPDDELLAAAERGVLSKPQAIARQVRRMTADARSSLVSSFAGQWLYLRNLRNQTPDSNEFPDFDDNLRQAFLRETEMFVDSIIREDRPVTDLLTADYTFVNERSARHYGIPNISGSQMRRVTLPSAGARRGLLGQGSILMVTSHVDRTSPVVRGKWILDNVVGTPPPPPPPEVPPLPVTEAAKAQTMRERMEAHRANPACAGCHRIMDPIGFSLENFDAVGKWRTSESRKPIDASGQLADGTSIDGPAQLREALLRDPEMFVRTVAEKLLTYAVGRGLTHRDMPTVREIVRESARDNYRFSALLMAVVNSAPFRTAIVPVADAERQTATSPKR